MRSLTLILASFSFLFFVGCSGAGTAATPAADDSASTNTASGTGDSSGGSNPPSSGGSNPPSSGGGTTPPTNDPAPGDKVEVSEPDPRVTYPSVGSPMNYDRNQKIEPQSDGVVPLIAITSHPNAYIPETSGQIQLWAADDNGGSGLENIQCSIDGGAFADCTSQVDLSNLSEGVHTIEARATDYDGNTSTEVSYSFYVDTTPPTVVIANAPAPTTAQPTSNFQFESQDAGSGTEYYECRIDSGTLKRCSDQEIFQNLDDGSHAVYVRAVDAVGNKSPTVVHRWVQDTAGPNIQFVKQPSPTIYVDIDNPVINFTAIDELSPSEVIVTCALNGQAVACSSGVDINVPSSSPTNYTFTVTATDQLGNSSAASIQWESLFIAESRTTLLAVSEDRPVDILFVVDNSGSMNFERSNLADRIDGMISKIEGLDWQIAIASTDSTNTNERSDGQLIELHGMAGQYVLDASMDTAQAQTVFGTTVQNFGGGSGNEEGIYSSRRVIERFLDGQATHTNFLRDGADLSIVVLSDEDESSNGQGARITPQEFVDFVTSSFNGNKNMVFHSIIARPGDTDCLNGEGAVAGNIYDELSRLTGFGQVGGAIIGSVCEADYTSQLEDIGQSVKDMRNSLKLDCNPYDANNDGQPDLTISYRANSSGAYTTYTAVRQIQGSTVTFTELLPPGEYKADYQCRIN